MSERSRKRRGGGEAQASSSSSPPPPPAGSSAGGPGGSDSDSDSDDYGPMPVAPGSGGQSEGDAVGSDGPKRKKKRVLEFERVYLDRLPCADMYEKSYMHRDNVTHVVVTPRTDFVVTGSVDGHLKFWKIIPGGVEFVKHYKAHLSPLVGMAASADGSRLCTTSEDKTAKFYDVLNFDMVNMFALDYDPTVCAWAYAPGSGAPARIAIAEAGAGTVRVYDADGSGKDCLAIDIHRAPGAVVQALVFVRAHDCMVSLDTRGMIEYWRPADGVFPAAEVKFKHKIDTDLYHLAKAKVCPVAVAVSADGASVAVTARDQRVRVFTFATGKLRREYDESAPVFAKAQADGSLPIDQIDFGRRAAVESELMDAVAGSDTTEGYGQLSGAPPSNPAFDASGHFLLYPTLAGVKVVNIVTNKVVKTIGMVESGERFLNIALYQGIPKTDSQTALRLASQSQKKKPAGGVIAGRDGGKDGDKDMPDPMLFSLAFKRNRFYIFSRREPSDDGDAATAAAAGTEGRDVFNEKPSVDEMAKVAQESVSHALGRQATIHTTAGDITIKLFPDECPRTVENFCTHARNSYYDNVIFHRVIKGFMLQTGDPDGDGTGGESIWGGEFEDEFHRNLRHDRPFTVSMANAGPGTNGSQFFITTVPTPWLDNKHTVFGRVIRGMDVCHELENVKCDKLDKPFEDVNIVNITVA